MAVISWNLAKKNLIEVLKNDYASKYKLKTKRAIHNWEKLAEAYLQADKNRAYDAQSSMRTAEFIEISKATSLDRLVDLPFKHMNKIRHGKFLWSERDNKPKWKEEEKRMALKKELQGLLEHIKDNPSFANFVRSYFCLPTLSSITDIEIMINHGELWERINRYNKLYAQIIKSNLKTSKFDYQDLYYRNGSDRYYLTDLGRQYLRKVL